MKSSLNGIFHHEYFSLTGILSYYFKSTVLLKIIYYLLKRPHFLSGNKVHFRSARCRRNWVSILKRKKRTARILASQFLLFWRRTKPSIEAISSNSVSLVIIAFIGTLSLCVQFGFRSFRWVLNFCSCAEPELAPNSSIEFTLIS